MSDSTSSSPPVRYLSRAEIAAWEAEQDPDKLPPVDLKRLGNLRRFLREQARLAAIATSRSAGRAVKLSGKEP